MYGEGFDAKEYVKVCLKSIQFIKVYQYYRSWYLSDEVIWDRICIFQYDEFDVDQICFVFKL